jgi:hypothetical protein
LWQFQTNLKPSRELSELEKSDGADALYELMKNIQQYPERYSFKDGTFLIDWTLCKDIALYFATYKGRGKKRTVSDGHGAIWICDTGAIGNVLHRTKPLREILSLMNSEEFLEGNKPLPLIIHPAKQTPQLRAINQKVVYIAQMNYKCDLADVWKGYEDDNKKRAFIKLILRGDLKNDAANYFESQRITENLVYPE